MGDNLSSRYYRSHPLRPPVPVSHPFAMGKKKFQRTYVREWRKHRQLTQAQLADRLEGVISQGSLSDLERGEFAYTQPTLEAIAKALRCAPADLIMRPPGAVDIIREAIDAVPEPDKPKVLAIIQAFKTGTNG